MKSSKCLLCTAKLISTRNVIPAKAGIQKNTGFRVKPGMTTSRGLIALVIVCLLALTMLWGCGPKEKSEGMGSIESAPEAQATVQATALEERRVEGVEVIPQTVAYTLSAIGSLKSPEDIAISPKKSGIIEKVLVKEGERVSRGQIVVQLDEADARLQVERAEACVKEAEASLETNRTTLLRYQRLLESKVIPQQVYDDVSLKVKMNEARVAVVKTELNLARQNLSDHRILSPIEGIVNLKIASLGEHVNVAPKDEIVTIVQMNPLDLEFSVPEGWVGKIPMGSRIQFTVKAFPDEKFIGVLQFISPTADPATRNVKLKAVVHNTDYRLKPGFFTEVTLQTGSNPNALVIPECALVTHEGKCFAYVVQNGVAHRKEVEPGLRFEGKVEVVKGIQKGEWVVTAGHEQLSEGEKVKKTVN